jgi:hypothetical protein
MIDFIEAIGLLAVALVAIAVGVGTVRHIGSDGVPSLSRTSDRRVSRYNEPVGFWMTIATGFMWLLLGIFLLTVLAVGILGF